MATHFNDLPSIQPQRSITPTFDYEYEEAYEFFCGFIRLVNLMREPVRRYINRKRLIRRQMLTGVLLRSIPPNIEISWFIDLIEKFI